MHPDFPDYAIVQVASTDWSGSPNYKWILIVKFLMCLACFMMPVRPRRKMCNRPAPYTCKPSAKVSPNAPATSAITQNSSWDNLTLHDWVTIFTYVDSHPNLGQAEVVHHFQTQQNALIFTQSTLSCKLKMRPELIVQAQSHTKISPTYLNTSTWERTHGQWGLGCVIGWAMCLCSWVAGYPYAFPFYFLLLLCNLSRFQWGRV